MTLSAPSIHYIAILPPVILMVAALGLLFLTALARRKPSTTTATLVGVGAVVAGLVVVVLQLVSIWHHGGSTTLSHEIVMDGFSSVVTGGVLTSLLFSLLVAHDWSVREKSGGAEYQMLAMLAVSGALIMAIANDLIVVFLGLEILSIALYVMIAFNKKRFKSAESSLKYFILGGLASSLFFYGAALVYGATGSTNLSTISYFLSFHVLAHPGLLWAGGALMLVGLSFKCQAVPFHAWSPDVYEGAPTPVTGFHASIVWGGAFAALIRVVVSTMGTQMDTWRPILFVLCALSTLVGAGMALRQTNIKRFLAYTSVSQAGFIFLAVWAGSGRGVSSAVFYLLTYAPTVVASFAVVGVMGGLGDANHYLERYTGLARRQPVLGGALALLLLAQLGAPLTTGFYAKLTALQAGVDAGGAPLALISILAACIAAFAYLRWVLALFSKEGTETEIVRVPFATRFTVTCGVVTAVIFGIWPGPLVALAQHASLLFLP